jgi:hypothetical protein
LWRTLCIVRSLLYWCLGQQRYKLVIIMYTWSKNVKLEFKPCLHYAQFLVWHR